MKPIPLTVVALVTAIGPLAPAAAGRPLATEDAGVLASGDCEVESFLMRASARGVPRASGLSLQFGCGVSLSTQAALAATRERSAGQTTRALAVTGKTSVVDGGGDKPSLTLAWGVMSLQPAAGPMKLEDLFLNGVASMPLGGQTALHANLGWTRTRSARQHVLNWNLAIEHGLPAGIDVMAEAYADNRDRKPWLAAGLRWHALPERLFLDASVALQAASSRPRLFTLGLKAAF